MATFKVVLDTRYKHKDKTHRYCLRTMVEGKVRYLPLDYKLTEEQHNLVFKKMSTNADCIDLREKFSGIETHAQRIFSSMRHYDPERFKQLFYKKDGNTTETDPSLPKTLAMKELFEYYMNNTSIKVGTKIHMKVALSMLQEFHHNVYVDEIDVKFLKNFEKKQLGKQKSISTVASYMRDIRTVLNYFIQVKKVIPRDYNYPFGKGGYSIKLKKMKKNVLQEDEILSLIELNNFEDQKQEYAYNIFMLLYYACGINPIDLLKLRWQDLDHNHFHFIRTKTETTRKSEVQELVIPLTEEVKFYLNKVGDPTSSFVLGKLHEGYTDQSLRNRKNRFRQEINTELKKIGKRLNLSVILRMSSARDAYASTLDRNGEQRENISSMLGHSDIRTTANYLDSLSIKKTFDINDKLVKRKKTIKSDEYEEPLVVS
jgi:integrase